MSVTILLCVFTTLWADEEPQPVPEETMLMFVGEETKVLSIASRREQSAWQAPAIARVLNRNELRDRGAFTLSNALKNIPGFYAAQKEWGTQPYLRGIPNSVLFLYDTVPVGSEMTKFIHQLDHDLSLWSVKRVEMVNGPASVLWGPDAFAGIVNVVPMTGKDLDGVEAGVLYQGPGGHLGFFANAGCDQGLWNGFLSVSGRRGEEDDRPFGIVRFQGDGSAPLSPEERFGEGLPGESKYLEVYGNFSYDDWLNLSARMSYNDRPYAMISGEGSASWGESRGSPFGYVKVEAKRPFARNSALKFTGFYSELQYEHDVIDWSQTQEERTTYAELVYDRSMMAGTAIFTGGFSYREKSVQNAPLWQGYLPGYLESNNPAFFPIIFQESYDSRLWSIFGQFHKTIDDFNMFAGLRHDMHDDFEDQTSLSAGIGWSPSSSWRYKLMGGTAYRTPFARQLYEEGNPDLEEIRSLNMQIAWEKPRRMGFSATGFCQWLEDHVMEDPYAGISLPNEQKIHGLELEGHYSPSPSLKIEGNVTLLENRGSDETYRYLDSIEIDDEGNIVKVYDTKTYPYDLGADSLFNVMVTWQPMPGVILHARTGYAASRSLIYPRDDAFEIVSVSGEWLVDLGAVIRDVPFPGADLDLSVKNLTDNSYQTPGTYDLMEGPSITVQAVLRVTF
ncbi:MAG: TonB-dependent receptor plug domain-containing protein [Deltaproteobacteria bacterium]|nr:TonB-dependent receptor plug domain-containing protein [Deltaproteobacteria bacterium]